MSDIRGFTSLKLCSLNEVIFFNKSGVESDFKNLSLSKTFHLYDFGRLSREIVSLCNGIAGLERNFGANQIGQWFDNSVSGIT